MLLVQDKLGDFCVQMVGHSEFWSLDSEPYFADGKGDMDMDLEVAGKQSRERMASAFDSLSLLFWCFISIKQKKKRKKINASINVMLLFNFITSYPSSERSYCASLCGFNDKYHAIDRGAL
ncbi:unnamed protein product [Fusarium venenatum]|uniref:Uncharacterized protein n=1 Tax=Fusarium venenatum TaxID=56646 RepID=A0A2L2TQP3_9HYPO|nr:uncharacterized protein FVRRES_06331 [Fusarium venenatum]CEI61895.1 unnamed protein product [Fusarium venenatum]